jgi:murein peptide amidase A
MRTMQRRMRLACAAFSFCLLSAPPAMAEPREPSPSLPGSSPPSSPAASKAPLPAANKSPGPASAAKPPASAASAEVPPDARTDVLTTCERLVAKLPSYPKGACARAGLSLSGQKSVRQVPILVREQPAVPEPVEGAMRVLFVGGIHGDELTAAELSLRWLERLSSDEAQRFHWRFIPVLNPDGLLAQRPSRTNANGVDLNRNFPSGDWAGGALKYWERMTMKDPRRYPGRAPITEPESRWFADEIERFAPDVIISVHAPLGLLDFDGPTTAPSRFGKLYLEPVGVYPGSLGSYSGITLGIPVVTLELPHALKMPTKDEQDRIWHDMVTWLAEQPSRLAQGPKE